MEIFNDNYYEAYARVLTSKVDPQGNIVMGTLKEDDKILVATATDEKEIISEVKDYLKGASFKDYEEGHVVFRTLKKNDGVIASQDEIEKWRNGDLELYESRYNISIEEVKRSPLFEDEKALKERLS